MLRSLFGGKISQRERAAMDNMLLRRDSSQLGDPCSKGLEPSPGLNSSGPGLEAPPEWKDSSPLGSCTTLRSG